MHFFLFFEEGIPTAGIQSKQKIVCFRSRNLHFTTTSQQAVNAIHPCAKIQALAGAHDRSRAGCPHGTAPLCTQNTLHSWKR